MGEGVEMEVKYRVEDLDSAIEALTHALGLRLVWEGVEEDTYFRLRRCGVDAVARVRRRSGGGAEEWVLTFKSRVPGYEGVKVRREYETRVENGDPIIGFFVDAGFEPLRVRKVRRVFEGSLDGLGFSVTADFVEGLGSFVEVEVMGDREGLERVLSVVEKVLGKGRGDRIVHSYLSMVLRARGG